MGRCRSWQQAGLRGAASRAVVAHRMVQQLFGVFVTAASAGHIGGSHGASSCPARRAAQRPGGVSRGSTCRELSSAYCGAGTRQVCQVPACRHQRSQSGVSSVSVLSVVCIGVHSRVVFWRRSRARVLTVHASHPSWPRARLLVTIVAGGADDGLWGSVAMSEISARNGVMPTCCEQQCSRGSQASRFLVVLAELGCRVSWSCALAHALLRLPVATLLRTPSHCESLPHPHTINRGVREDERAANPTEPRQNLACHEPTPGTARVQLCL